MEKAKAGLCPGRNPAFCLAFRIYKMGGIMSFNLFIVVFTEPQLFLSISPVLMIKSPGWPWDSSVILLLAWIRS